jgi:hypothetical protein
MDVQDALQWCDQVITEVDLELYQWTTDLDMMSFIGQEIPLRLWTNDDPPVVMELSNFKNTLPANKPVRVMHHVNGEWTQVGSAEIDPATGMLLGTLTQEVPELTRGVVGGFSVHSEEGPLAHFHINRDGDWKQNVPIHPEFDPEKHWAVPANVWREAANFPPFEGLNKPLTVHGLDKIIAEIEEAPKKFITNMSVEDTHLEHHPFFDKEKD